MVAMVLAMVIGAVAAVYMHQDVELTDLLDQNCVEWTATLDSGYNKITCIIEEGETR